MKVRLNLSIEKDLIRRMKEYAKNNNTTLSELVEDHFRSLIIAKRPNILDLINELPKPDVDDNLDLKKAFYEENAAKYGF